MAPLFDLFSKRQKRARGEVPDVYQYDKVPAALRVQIVHILRDAMGEAGPYREKGTKAYEFLHDTLAREYGVFMLASARTREAALIEFFLHSATDEQALDVIELSFRIVDTYCRRDDYRYEQTPRVTADEAIAELNARFREHAVGYQYESGELIRVDSQLIHSEVIKPTLHLLRDPLYSGANTEYLRAHEHYRHGRYEEAIADALKAFESTMKAICHKRKWAYGANDTAKQLLDVCFREGLIPTYLQSEFTALRSSLEAGVPTVRNKQSGHGQGVQKRAVPQYLAAYLLHLAATNIVLLVNSEKNLA